jgi:hypothetical protein
MTKQKTREPTRTLADFAAGQVQQKFRLYVAGLLPDDRIEEVNDAVARVTPDTCDGGGGVIHIFGNTAE